MGRVPMVEDWAVEWRYTQVRERAESSQGILGDGANLVVLNEAVGRGWSEREAPSAGETCPRKPLEGLLSPPSPRMTTRKPFFTKLLSQ